MMVSLMKLLWDSANALYAVVIAWLFPDNTINTSQAACLGYAFFST